jgi:hypothetical protein
MQFAAREEEFMGDETNNINATGEKMHMHVQRGSVD